jgi:hypothetical protein
VVTFVVLVFAAAVEAWPVAVLLPEASVVWHVLVVLAGVLVCVVDEALADEA